MGKLCKEILEQLASSIAGKIGSMFQEEQLSSFVSSDTFFLPLLFPIQVTKRIYFCFSVIQDCLQLIADSATPTIREGNEMPHPTPNIPRPVTFLLTEPLGPITCDSLFKLHRTSTLCLTLLRIRCKVRNLNVIKMTGE